MTAAGVRGTLLLIAHAFPPAPMAGGQRPGRLARFLPALGFRVHVLTATDEPATRVAGNVTRVSSQVLPRRRRAQWVLRRTEIAAARLVFPGGEHHALAWVPAARRAALELVRREGVTHVLSTFPPLAPHLVAVAIKRRHPQLRWIADFRDPLAHNPATSRRAEACFQRFERRFVARADQVIANTDVVAETLRAAYPERRDRITHVWNGFDPDEALGATPIPRRAPRHLVHVGEIYGGRDPGPIFSALDRLLRANRLAPGRAQVHLLGELDRASLRDAGLVDRLEATGHVVTSPALLWGPAAVRAMAEADGLLVVDWAGHAAGRQVPSKLFSYIRIGRPILAITTPDSPTDRILRGSGVPHVSLYPGERPERHDDKLLAFLALPSDPTPPSPWFLSEFDGRRQAAVVADLMAGT